MRRLIAIVTLLAATLSAPALAWGLTGHRIVGALAQDHLDARAQAGVSRILGTESLAEAAPWPDFMRSSSEAFWKQSVPLHYVTVPTGKSYAEVGAPSEGDAVTALAKFTAVVRNPASSLADRQRALRFIIHIVGDLHQPLHVGRPGDKGGNDVKVSFFGDPTNLHTVWDSTFIDREKLSYTEWANFLRVRQTPDNLDAWSNPDPQVWIAESAAARETIYPVTPDLGYAYVFEHKATLDLALERAGIRLAAYLNWIFASPSRQR
ncbi:endonuclease [Polymorphobacter glacialis]|uniref:Endonuclease n=1 Tax=Sandarakinorhabdus glacialis TaxID=1614636 RepID=A0A916ZMJ5_9SPHN|nr:S1/P1 nuclease [Polymorphobacter glacialis]GGE03102.1 endonuclease [Polymorphobacter glacialis]